MKLDQIRAALAQCVRDLEEGVRHQPERGSSLTSVAFAKSAMDFLSKQIAAEEAHGMWAVLCSTVDKDKGEVFYFLDNKVFTSREDAINANENAGWPGSSVMVIKYPQAF